MLADGVFGTLHPQAIFGLHTSPAPVGWLGSAPGVLMAGRDRLTITIAGTGNLQSAADTVRRLIQSVGTIRRDQEAQPAPEGFVLAQVGPVERGSHGTWTVHGTLTIAGADARRRARDVLTRQLDALSLPDVQVRVAYDAKAIAGVTNDSLLVAKADASIRRVLGQDAVSTVTGIYPAFSEDFGSFQERIPGAFYFLGVSNREKGWLGLPHSPAYVADEASILVGARAMSAVILDRLAETPRR
jgi:metal-dependent amidase/aminoacylase/carboxypeptidase family protein